MSTHKIPWRCGAPVTKYTQINLDVLIKTLLTTHLELHSIAELPSPKWTKAVHDNSFDERLDSFIKVSGGSVTVLPDELVLCCIS